MQTELGEIKWAADYEKTHKVRIRDLIRGKSGSEGGTCALRRILLGMGAQAMQQLSGKHHSLSEASKNTVSDNGAHHCRH